MRNPAQIRPIYAHAKGDSRGHHHFLTARKAPMRFTLGAGFHAGVKGNGFSAIITQPGGGAFGFCAAAAIDNAGATSFANQGADLAAFILTRRGFDQDIGPVEGSAKHRRFLQAQLQADIFHRARIGGCGQCHARHMRKARAQYAKAAIFGPEMMAPLADAMRFIHRKQGDIQAFQPRLHRLQRQPLRRDVKQLQRPIVQIAQHAARFIRRQFRMQSACGDTLLAERRNLVFHQRNQGGHNNPNPRAAKCGHLKAEAFAAAGRHQDQP